MQITVLGAGAMGSFFGGLLAEAGHAVELLDVNETHLAALREGLRLSTDAGERCIVPRRACRPEEASGSPDLLILFTKTMHTQAALAGVRHLLSPQTFVLSLQNGLGNVEKIESAVPRSRILIGCTTWPADLVGPGHVQSHGVGEVRIMSADGEHSPQLQACVQALDAAGLRCTPDPAVWQAIWEKVAFNAAINSMCAVTGCTVDELALLPQGPELAVRVVGEVIETARAAGVAADARAPAQKVLDAIEHHRGHKPSMLQDMEARRPTEIGAINAAVVETARRLGVNAPCTEALMVLVQLKQARQLARA
jgi:2-dehydropantoate 2-reductase